MSKDLMEMPFLKVYDHLVSNCENVTESFFEQVNDKNSYTDGVADFEVYRDKDCFYYTVYIASFSGKPAPASIFKRKGDLSSGNWPSTHSITGPSAIFPSNSAEYSVDGFPYTKESWEKHPLVVENRVNALISEVLEEKE